MTVKELVDKLDLNTKEQIQANVEYNPKLQVPKEELEKIRMENILLERQIRESLSQLKTESAKAMLLRAIYYMMAKARIDQYGYIPDPDPWRDLNG